MTVLPPFSSFGFPQSNSSRSSHPPSSSPFSKHTRSLSPNSHPLSSPCSTALSDRTSPYFSHPTTGPSRSPALSKQPTSPQSTVSPRSGAASVSPLAQPWSLEEPVGTGFAASRKRKLEEAAGSGDRTSSSRFDEVAGRRFVPLFILSSSSPAVSDERSKAARGESPTFSTHQSNSSASHQDPTHPSYYPSSGPSPTDSVHSIPSPPLQTPQSGTFPYPSDISTYYTPPLKNQRSTPSFASSSSGSSFSSIRSSERSSGSNEGSTFPKLPSSRNPSLLAPYDLPGSSARLYPPSHPAPPAVTSRRPWTIETTHPATSRDAPRRTSVSFPPPLIRHRSDPSNPTRSPPRNRHEIPHPPLTPGTSLASSISILSLLNGSPPPPLPRPLPLTQQPAPIVNTSPSISSTAPIFSSTAPHPHRVIQLKKSLSNIERVPIQRTTRACDACRGRKTRCLVEDGEKGGDGSGKKCQRCKELGLDCTWSGGSKKRGPIAGSVRRVSPTTPHAALASADYKADSYFNHPHPTYNHMPSQPNGTHRSILIPPPNVHSRSDPTSNHYPTPPHAPTHPPSSHQQEAHRPSVLSRPPSLEHVGRPQSNYPGRQWFQPFEVGRSGEKGGHSSGLPSMRVGFESI